MEKFKLVIDAVSPDGKAINSHIESNINCSKEMAVGVIAHFLRKEKEFIKMFAQALLYADSEYEIDEQISEDDFLDSINAAKSKETEL